MRLLFMFFFILTVMSCKEGSNSKILEVPVNAKNNRDTVIVKNKNDIHDSYDDDFLSKKYSYYWVTANDTLDFGISATEYKDSSLHLGVRHKRPILFSSALKRIGDCMKIIQEDFNISNLSSFYFKSPIYYSDLSYELSKEYDQTFGRKIVDYQKQNQFLLKSEFNIRLNTFLYPIGKKVSGYGIEKFQLLNKEDYNIYLKDIDLNIYPDFIINGMGISIRLTADR